MPLIELAGPAVFGAHLARPDFQAQEVDTKSAKLFNVKDLEDERP